MSDGAAGLQTGGATFFATPADFRRWLRRNHKNVRELWVGFHKKGTGQPSITWPESVDEALCVGWIDGIRKSLGADSYVIRFTPRKPGSIWSDVNTRRAKALVQSGRMQPAGLRAFKARDPRKSGVYAFEQKQSPELIRAELAAFKANKRAWDFFQTQPPYYRRVTVWWVVRAKQAPTRARRLATLIADSADGRRIGPMRRSPEK